MNLLQQLSSKFPSNFSKYAWYSIACGVQETESSTNRAEVIAFTFAKTVFSLMTTPLVMLAANKLFTSGPQFIQKKGIIACIVRGVLMGAIQQGAKSWAMSTDWKADMICEPVLFAVGNYFQPQSCLEKGVIIGLFRAGVKMLFERTIEVPLEPKGKGKKTNMIGIFDYNISNHVLQAMAYFNLIEQLKLTQTFFHGIR